MIADGKLVSANLKQKIVDSLKNKTKKEVCFVIFGNDRASQQFIAMKCRFAESLGIPTRVVEHRENLSFGEIKNIIEEISRGDISGIVVQLPLPIGVPTQDILDLVPKHLDIDVLSSDAKEAYKNNITDKVPPVARAVGEILDFYNIDLTNKEILVIGSGRLVGEPVKTMFDLRGITFKSMDKETHREMSKNLIASADIIICGAGSSYMIKPDMIKEGVVLIDAGTSEQNGKIVGDVDPACADKAALITPVPGGVGPVTLASLFMNI